jgi:c-di-GMP-binding flagellar brake protein YcgR
MSFIPLGKGDVIFGRPLPWSIHDRDGNLLLHRGHVIESRARFDALLRQELYRASEPRLALVSQHDTPTTRKAADAALTTERIEKLESIKLHVGDTMQLQSLADDGTRYYVKLIGYACDKSVLVTTPAVDNRVCLMREGQSFVVRAFSGRNAYAFTASIFKVANTPFPHLHLTYPHEVRSARVRKDSRIDTSIIAAVTVPNARQGDNAAAATITNLSVGGALLAAPKPLGRGGDRLSIKFRLALHDIEVYLTLDAIVRSVGHDVAVEGAAAAFTHGVQFVNVPEQHVVALTAYVYHMLADESAAA